MWFPGFCLKVFPMWNHYGLWCDFIWRHSMTSWCQVRSWYVCVSLSVTKKGTLGQKDRTILETRELCERSGVFIIQNDWNRKGGIFWDALQSLNWKEFLIAIKLKVSINKGKNEYTFSLRGNSQNAKMFAKVFHSEMCRTYKRKLWLNKQDKLAFN